MRRPIWRLVAALAALLALLTGGFVGWALSTNPVMVEAEAALATDTQVSVEQGRWIVFRPAQGQPDAGLIFYPGGRVDPRAYAPLARAVAAEGYLAVIVPMPLNLAVLGIERAGAVIDAYPEVERWVVGGHSLGAAMAAGYAYRQPERVDGLALLAGYPAASNSLAGAGLRVVSVYGTLDGLATPEQVEESRALLPPGARLVPVEGGNHAQFGHYGTQRGDNPATISREAQQAQTLAAILALLEEIGSP